MARVEDALAPVGLESDSLNLTHKPAEWMQHSITEQFHKIWIVFFPAFLPYSVLEIEKRYIL